METLLTTKELLSGINGVPLNFTECFFTSVATDSREVKENTMFVPLVGTVQNGHKYIPSAIKSGASVVLLNEAEVEGNKDYYSNLVKNNPQTLFVTVTNTLHGLQDAAETYVSKFPELLKIAITGSCGKTTTKEMMVSVAKAHFGEDATVYTKGNYNSETGLPLSVFQIRENHKCGIFEMGMNRVDEIGEISKVLKAKFAIITNVGTAHIGILGSRENIALEKRKAFNYIPADGSAFVPAEDDFADFCLENVKGNKIKFGKNIEEEKSGVKFHEDRGILGTDFSIDGIKIRLPLIGEYNFINALGVIACAKAIGITAEEIKTGLENMSCVSGRMEIQEDKLSNGKAVILLKDFYNANPDSMTKAVEFCGSLRNTGKKIFILADMKELGKESKKAHKAIGQLIAPMENYVALLIGKDIKPAYKEIKKVNRDACIWYKDNSPESFAAVKNFVLDATEENSVILFKGSHSMNLEGLCNLIQEAK